MTTVTATAGAPDAASVPSRRTPPPGMEVALIAIRQPGWYDDAEQPLAEHYFDGRVWLASRWKGFPQITPAPGATRFVPQISPGPEAAPVPELMPAPLPVDPPSVDEVDVPAAVLVAADAAAAARGPRPRRRHLALVAGYAVGVGVVAVLSGEVVLRLG